MKYNSDLIVLFAGIIMFFFGLYLLIEKIF